MQTSKKAFLLVVVASSIGLIFLGAKLNQQNGWINSFVALGEIHEDGEFYVTPSQVTVDQAESTTFMSYTESSTESVPTKAVWTVEDKKDDDGSAKSTESQDSLDSHSDRIADLLGDVENQEVIKEALTQPQRAIIMGNCENSTSCNITIGNNPGKFTVTATAKDKTATADLTVKDEMKESTFRDKVPDWAEEGASMLQSNNIMLGYADGDFGASDPVSRGQLTVLLYRIMTEYQGVDSATLMSGKKCDNLYTDVPFDHYAYDAICFGKYYNWFTGVSMSGVEFDPEGGLTRREVAQMVYNVVGKSIVENADSPFFGLNHANFHAIALGFKDVKSTESSDDAIGVMSLLGVMNGTEMNGEVYLYPDRSPNRGETATILWRLIQKMDLYL